MMTIADLQVVASPRHIQINDVQGMVQRFFFAADETDQKVEVYWMDSGEVRVRAIGGCEPAVTVFWERSLPNSAIYGDEGWTKWTTVPWAIVKEAAAHLPDHFDWDVAFGNWLHEVNSAPE